MKNEKKIYRIWIYVVAFIISVGLPIMNLFTFDSKKVISIILIAFVNALVFGTIVNLVLNWLADKNNKLEKIIALFYNSKEVDKSEF